jgi:ribosome-binding protein aMBF1 (putative translation factor)
MASNQHLVPFSHKCKLCGKGKEDGASFTVSNYKYIRKVCNVCRRSIEDGKIASPPTQPYTPYENRRARREASKAHRRKLIRRYIAEYFRLNYKKEI